MMEMALGIGRICAHVLIGISISFYLILQYVYTYMYIFVVNILTYRSHRPFWRSQQQSTPRKFLVPVYVIVLWMLCINSDYLLIQRCDGIFFLVFLYLIFVFLYMYH